MGYLDNSSITVDAILTKKGRELLAKGRDFFVISQFALADDEVDAIEQYIENSAPPEGVNLNNQYSEELVKLVNDYVNRQVQSYGFSTDIEVVAAGREGSNHPLRSDARRVLEYYDAIWNVYLNIMNEVKETREDLLKEFEFYANQLPNPQQSLIG